ncbi:MAG: maleylpyruvate isomerase N-terminal domain-containing protein [Acidimicrobiia bacterium]|nr:maleylpyruvate isomerase N-terminal domain-containing protein [Acidimicrobiia bacterium]
MNADLYLEGKASFTRLLAMLDDARAGVCAACPEWSVCDVVAHHLRGRTRRTTLARSA